MAKVLTPLKHHRPLALSLKVGANVSGGNFVPDECVFYGDIYLVDKIVVQSLLDTPDCVLMSDSVDRKSTRSRCCLRWHRSGGVRVART